MTFKQVNTEENSWMFDCRMRESICFKCKHVEDCIVTELRDCGTAEILEERGFITEFCNFFTEAK